MKPTQDKYPHFEANQVLTNSHLNQVFDYLDEQDRLTRANLIGIGIVCGLEFKTETNSGNISIHVSRGVGVGSAGYLLNQPEHVTLVTYREYTLPNEVDYPNFKFDDGGLMKQYPLWELFAAGEPNTLPLNSPAGFLNDKALILFLELKMEGLRNCSPNDCNDKGEEVTATLRHLLIRIADLEKIIAAASNLPGNFSLSGLEQSFTGRLNLPDIRMPRWDVEATSPSTSMDVLKGFHRAFSLDKISELTGKALSATYQAFKPLVGQEFPTDPFAGFASKFGFLDNTNIPAEHLKFIQYYHGFFEDLLNAYDEFRWKGIRMMCACAPPEDLFPRHLMLGVINPSSVNNPGLFRNHFIPSPAISNCEDQIRELRQLFARLVEMIVKFTHTPPLPQSGQENRLAQQIRITPDKLADVPLSEKAIPYYYLQSGPKHLFRLWNYERTQRGRANQNLSYRSDEFIPVPPNFVLDPLRFDLEPYNFLRIEGHLGLNYQAAFSSILAQKNRFRLPIDVIALRTGVFDEQNLNVRNEGSCHFNDLEAQYDSRVAELTGFLGGNLKFFYDLYFAEAKGLIDVPIPSIIPWFVAWDPDFRVKPNTVGAFLEKNIFNTQLTAPYFDPDNLTVNLFQFINNSNESQKELILIYIGYYIARFPDVLTADLTELNLDELNNREKDITRVAEAIELKHEQFFTEGEQREPIVKWEDLDDRLEALVYGHYSDSIKALLKEYQRRIKEFNKLQYLGHYLRKNPGFQHKAGVPIGGTFILVYHGDDKSDEGNIKPITGNFVIRGQVVVQNRQPIPGATVLVKGTNQGASTDFFGNFIIRTSILPITLRVVLAGFSPVEKLVRKEGFVLIDLLSGSDKSDPDISSDFFPGEVIADFYLPYLCCSDCAPVQFVLPLIPPTFSPEIGCTDLEGNARVIIKPFGGSPPYRLKINDGNFTEITETITLQPGEFTLVIQDSAGVDSALQNITIAEPLVLGRLNFDCIGENNEYVADFRIIGGTPPYTSNIGRIIDGRTFISEALEGETDHEVIIEDSRGCTASVIFSHSCKPGLSFQSGIGCSNADNFAAVEIFVSGGTSPYEIQVDKGDFEALVSPIHLPAGQHTLVVRDASGTQTPQQEIEIPGRVELGRTNFDCIGENNEYVADFRISGGTPPYASNIGRIIDGRTFISDPLAGGTDHEVIIQDSRGCTASTIVNHSCLVSIDLTFKTNISCTGSDGTSLVEINPQGGSAPYSVQFGTQPFQPLNGPIPLPAGIHQITLRDAFQQTATQTVSIPEALSLTVLKISCIRGNEFYQASIRINGGEAPYIAMGSAIEGDEFTTDVFPSGESAFIQVFDANKCQTSIEIQHNCDEPCDLPCEGETMECGYRLWLQPITKTQRYEVYQQASEVIFRFNDRLLPMPKADQLLQISTEDLNKDFDIAIERVIKILNNAINQALRKEFGDSSKNRITVSYNPQKSDPFSILRIEHFVCDKFSIDFSYNYGKSTPVFNLTAKYTNDLQQEGPPFNGAVFTNLGLDDKQMKVPAFDCSQRNICRDTPFEKFCRDNNLKPDFTIEPLGRIGFQLQSTTPGNEQVAWVWDIFETFPAEPFYEGENVRILVSKSSGVVRLTVITIKGCFAFTDKELRR
ncbi:MAG: carboxypeptidase-like regulatory domain-containing protein [Lentimicrobium sp.]